LNGAVNAWGATQIDSEQLDAATAFTLSMLTIGIGVPDLNALTPPR
jgi:hypothetical protein